MQGVTTQCKRLKLRVGGQDHRLTKDGDEVVRGYEYA
jgi:hypothetical protein